MIRILKQQEKSHTDLFIYLRLSSLLLIFISIISCSSSKPEVQSTPLPTTTNSPTTEIIPNNQDLFRQAINQAMNTSTSVQSAKLLEDWQNILAQWVNIIDLLKKIPNSDPNYLVAQKKITEYQKNLNYASQQISRLTLLENNDKAQKDNPVEKKVKATPQIPNNNFSEGMVKVEEAIQLESYAIVEQDWVQVAQRWEEAINLLKNVTDNDPNKKLANENINKYSPKLNFAKEKLKLLAEVNNPITAEENPPEILSSKVSDSSQESYSPQIISQSETTIPETNIATTPNSNNDSEAATEKKLIEEFINLYFNATVNKGSDGYEYWCEKGLLQSKIIAPRKWELLDIKLESREKHSHDGRGKFIGGITVRVESSTAGGIPVINNWSLNVVKQDPNIKNSYPGRYCVTILSKQD
jgi:hypothetical protein